MSDTKDTSTANHSETPNDSGVEKEFTDIDKKPMDPSNHRGNNSNSNSKDDVNAEVAAVIATNAAAANGKKRPLVDVTSTSPNKSVDAKDVKENNNHREDPQDENGHKEKEEEEEKVTKDTTKEPRSKKARTDEPPTASTTTNPQDSNQSFFPEKTKPIFGSATASAFAAYAVPKQPEQKQNAQPEQGDDDKLIDSIKDSDTNHVTTKSLNQGGFFGFSSAAGTATSAFSSVGNSSSVFGKGSSCTSLGFGMGGNPPTTGSSGGSSSSNFLSLSSSAFGGTSSTFGATPLSCTAENNQDAESSPVPPIMASLSQPIVPLPVLKEPVSNGEENEEAILTLRAKLFKLAKVKQVVANSTNVEDLAASSSSTGGRDTKKKSVGIEMATKVGQQPEKNAETARESTLESSNAVKMDWKEVGIGPLRVLTSSDEHARIVQRRENTPGGQGTKLILNVALRKECKVERKGDKFVRFAAFEVVEEENKSDKQDEKKETEDPSNHSRENVDNDTQQNSKDVAGKDSSVQFELVQYLFKVKTIGEADMLLETLGKYCSKMTASC